MSRVYCRVAANDPVYKKPRLFFIVFVPWTLQAGLYGLQLQPVSHNINLPGGQMYSQRANCIVLITGYFFLDLDV